MKTNPISHKDVIDRFVSYGENNFETTSVNNNPSFANASALVVAPDTVAVKVNAPSFNLAIASSSGLPSASSVILVFAASTAPTGIGSPLPSNSNEPSSLRRKSGT